MSIEALDDHLKALWKELLMAPEVAGFLTGPAIRDRRSYALHLTQVYHYTIHTPLNQARVALRDGLSPKYRRFCLDHAAEEVGHERMALHDLRAMGIDTAPEDFPLLPATEQKIAYLYWISEHAHPASRLGYSFWAEDSYGAGGPYLQAMKAAMGLSDHQTTFFTSHAAIDTKHVLDVRKALTAACTTDEAWTAVHRAMEQSIRLTFQLLKDEVALLEDILAGRPTAFTFLDAAVS